jgi:alpha-tubulin suppressor-like RCC1 family protein
LVSVTVALACSLVRFSAGGVTATGSWEQVFFFCIFARFVLKNNAFSKGDTVDKLTATAVKGLTSAVILVVCGSRHTCVKLRGTNKVVCFGLNDFGQSAQGISAPSSVPVTELRFIDNAGKESFASTIGAHLLQRPLRLPICP